MAFATHPMSVATCSRNEKFCFKLNFCLFHLILSISNYPIHSTINPLLLPHSILPYSPKSLIIYSLFTFHFHYYLSQPLPSPFSPFSFLHIFLLIYNSNNGSRRRRWLQWSNLSGRQRQSEVAKEL